MRVFRKMHAVGAKLQTVVVEDQTILREMLVEVLEATGMCHVVRQFATGNDAIADIPLLRPDLVVLDLMLPGTAGIDVLRKLRGLRRPPRVLVVTACDVPRIAADALAGGAHGIVSKGAPLSELRLAVERVASGGTYFCTLAAELLRRGSAAGGPDANLTPRERRILRMVAAGATSKEIAAELEITVKTVVNHRQNLMRKLGIHNVAGLTRFALANGVMGELGT